MRRSGCFLLLKIGSARSGEGIDLVTYGRRFVFGRSGPAFLYGFGRTFCLHRLGHLLLVLVRALYRCNVGLHQLGFLLFGLCVHVGADHVPALLASSCSCFCNMAITLSPEQDEALPGDADLLANYILRSWQGGGTVDRVPCAMRIERAINQAA